MFHFVKNVAYISSHYTHYHYQYACYEPHTNKQREPSTDVYTRYHVFYGKVKGKTYSEKRYKTAEIHYKTQRFGRKGYRGSNRKVYSLHHGV